MSKSTESPKLVTALFSFKGKNNDELCFKKGDVITITQIDDGGWWEGTLNEKTGWFPSNYVKEYSNGSNSSRSPDTTGGYPSVKSSPEKSTVESLQSIVNQRFNRDIVIKDLVDSERANVTELQSLITNFLQPLELANVLKKEEYKLLTGNITQVLEIHQKLLTNLDTAVAATGPTDSKIGNLFLMLAPRIKSVHMTYCNGHPHAVYILDQYRDELNEFMERSGAVAPGILVLTTGLSKPFRRLEKYAALLQELERHTEKNHSDRGDTQRSVCVYRDIAERCTQKRKQRELALHILTSGIKGWEGEELNSLGEILHVGPVTLHVQQSGLAADRRDRYFVLFPMTLLVLSTSARMSSFIYEGKLPLTGINVIPLDNSAEDLKNAFEISGPMIESIVVICASKSDCSQWIELLTTQDQQPSPGGILKSPTISHTSSQSIPGGKSLQLLSDSSSLPSPGTKTPPWNLASLRPAPPVYLIKNYGKFDSGESLCRSPRANNERQFEDDAIILKIIEGYCMTVNARFTVHSAVLDNDSPINKPRDRISVMNNKLGNLDFSEDSSRGLSKIVETLKTQVVDLQSQVMQLTRQLDEEKQSRLLLTAAMKRIGAIDNNFVPQ